MLLKYFYDDELAQASYLVGCQATGEAIVIDPSRDISAYLQTAEAEGVRIVGVTETHIHADFLSGARELAARTGAMLYLSAEGEPDWTYQFLDQYSSHPVHDGDTFNIGNIKFEVMHTPGHTPEHIALLVTDGGAKASAPMGLFSGDFVFVGDVGRPDLLEKAAGVHGSSDIMARKMFASLQRFKKLPDFLQLWPAHGAGSACGKALGAIPSSTVGYEKMVNWALAYNDEEAFVEALLEGQPEPPRYFAMMKKLNKEGPQLLSMVAAPQRAEESPETVRQWLDKGSVVDTRAASAFAKSHLAGVLNIPYHKSFVTWAGWLLDYDRPIYLLCAKGDVEAITKELQSIGLDNVEATMGTGVHTAAAAGGSLVTSYAEVEPEDAARRIDRGEVFLLDVRNATEWSEGHIPQATHIMLGHLVNRVQELPKDKPVLVQCRTGGRSAIAASILQAHGFEQVQNMLGGYEEWTKLGLAATTR
ncbi:rhodanese-like domain-containing protein [Alicyclobacillus sp. SP_1]|uniref:MBL fold metallo-hydrolase n=1 Tax=Alicyclobacillus sp. SP_1 TaxID=2942475 RepID=UPI002157E9F2|nr:MBL fold metallo-hydrolase [Alicyclobacillus sp. SP_1]